MLLSRNFVFLNFASSSNCGLPVSYVRRRRRRRHDLPLPVQHSLGGVDRRTRTRRTPRRAQTDCAPIELHFRSPRGSGISSIPPSRDEKLALHPPAILLHRLRHSGQLFSLLVFPKVKTTACRQFCGFCSRSRRNDPQETSGRFSE